MTKTRSTRSALVSAILVLTLCVSALLGTTFAWFTDSVTSAGNIIKSGTLDIELEKWDVETESWVNASNEPIFEYENWEPGYTEVVNLRVVNNGTLNLKWLATIVTEDELSILADVINVYVKSDDQNDTVREYIEGITDRTQFDTLTAEGKFKKFTLREFINGVSIMTQGTLAPEQESYLGIVLQMDTAAGNEYQNLDLAGNFELKILATQLTAEEDSFGPDYDEDAGYDYGKTNVGPYKLNVLANGVADYDGETKTYTVTVDSVAQGGWNQSQGNYYAGYTVNVEGYGDGAALRFDGADGSEVTWTLADEERDGFVNNGLHQQWTIVGNSKAYRYDIDGDGVTDFIVDVKAENAGVEVNTFDELNTTLERNAPVVLKADIALTETLTIANDANIDLNGHTISYVSTDSKASSAITNKGTLTLKNGTVTYEGVGDPNYGYGTNSINNSGKLVIDGVTVINNTDSGSSVAIDCYAGAELIVNSGEIISQKNAIRLCPFGTAAINCTINGGTITGARAIQIHLPGSNSAEAPDVNLTVNGGTLNGTSGFSIYSYSNGQSFVNVDVTITGGIFNNDVCFGGGAKATVENVTITGGTFNGYLGRYLANGGWEDIAKP